MSKEENSGEIWRSVFLTVILGIISIALTLSIFFYVRSREAIWDNRSKLSRLIASNHNVSNLGVEMFTMFGNGTGGITLNGSATIENYNTIYLTPGSGFVIEFMGFSRDSLGALSTFDSKILTDNVTSSSVTIMDSGDVQLTPLTIQINSKTGSDTFNVGMGTNRLELTGGTAGNTYQLSLRILGRKLV